MDEQEGGQKDGWKNGHMDGMMNAIYGWIAGKGKTDEWEELDRWVDG